MLSYNRDTAILFLVFNRPETTQQVFEKIKSARPQRLYVAADGPRDGNEAIRCGQVREIVKQIDWDCKLKTLFRDKNLGCKKAVSEGVTWFFSHEEEGIVLEDDCLPSDSFFGFCSMLLDRYRNSPQVAHISGANFQDGIIRGTDSYYFSALTHVWGWAGWRNVWENYDPDINDFPRFDPMVLKSNPSIKPFYLNWMQLFTMVYNGQINTWDFQYAYLNIKQQKVSIIPNQNLIKNIGIGPDATNTKSEHILANKELYEIDELLHPQVIEVNVEADLYTQAKEFVAIRRKNFFSRSWKKIKLLLK